jgi:general secretion pathway protein M
MNELKQKFQALTEREQILVLVSAVIVGLMLFYFALWQPLVNGIDREKALLERQTETLVWVEGQALKAAQLRAFTAGKGQFSGSLPQAVNLTSSRHSITISRMQPQNDELQVWVDEANFNNVLAWLQAMEKMGVLIQQVDITESGAPGMIKVRRLQLGKS